MRVRIARISVGQYQEVGDRVALCCVRDERESVRRKLKGPLVRTAREAGHKKRREKEDRR